MALTLDYPDAYLQRFCTDDREARAFAEVDLLPTFTATWNDADAKATWRDRCARIKCYLIACVENQAAPDDLFTAKLKSYRAEYDVATAQAEAALAADQSETATLGIWSIPMERA